MTKYARKALIDRYDVSVRMTTPVYPRVAGTAVSAAAAAISRALEDLVKREAMQGMQVCVVHGGSVVADVAAGCMGLLDPRPVTPSSLFPCLAVSRLACVALINSLAQSGLLGMHPRARSTSHSIFFVAQSLVSPSYLIL